MNGREQAAAFPQATRAHRIRSLPIPEFGHLVGVRYIELAPDTTGCFETLRKLNHQMLEITGISDESLGRS